MLNKTYETYERPGLIQNYKLGLSRIYKGALVGLTAAGAPAPLTPAAPMRFLGIAENEGNPAGPEAARGISVAKTGTFVLRAATGWSPAPTDLGRVVYAVSDWEVRPNSTGLANAIPVGIIVAIESTSIGDSGVRVRIDQQVN